MSPGSLRFVYDYDTLRTCLIFSFCNTFFASWPSPDASFSLQDPHCVPALLKQFFRELPRPLVSEDSSACFPLLREAMAVREANSDSRVALDHFRKALYKLSTGHYRSVTSKKSNSYIG